MLQNCMVCDICLTNPPLYESYVINEQRTASLVCGLKVKTHSKEKVQKNYHDMTNFYYSLLYKPIILSPLNKNDRKS